MMSWHLQRQHARNLPESTAICCMCCCMRASHVCPWYVVQAAQRLQILCQEKLLQQLPEAVRPAALAAAGHMVLDTSEPRLQSPAASHDEDPNAMSIDNASCTTIGQGTLRAPTPPFAGHSAVACLRP